MRNNPSRQTNLSTDVLVVGLGPAGIAASGALSALGASVLVIDRVHEPGVKACAGGFTRSSWELAGIDPKGGGANHFRSFDKLIVSTNIGTEIVKAKPILLTADRKIWAKQRIDELRDLSVIVNRRCAFKGFKDGVAMTDQGPIKFGKILGADGASSRIRRALNLGNDRPVLAWQIRISHFTAKAKGLGQMPKVWLLPNRFGAGYGWSFPGFDEVRIGVCSSGSNLAAPLLKKAFFNWLQELGISSQDGRVEVGKIGCDYKGHRFGDVFLAGDAAGLASPLTGEGISQALISGQEVAKEIVNTGYRSKIIPRLATKHRRTHDVLVLGPVHKILFPIAPWLLKISPIRNQTIKRYVD